MSKTTTKMAIAFAFKELLSEKALDKITVQEIAEKCEMNRKTFYYHFHDVLELCEWICESDAEKALQEKPTYETWQEGYLTIFQMIRKDRSFILNIYRHMPREYLYRYLYKVTFRLLYDVLEEKAEGMLIREEDKKFIADFYKYGFVGLLLEWIDTGMKKEPEKIVTRLNSLMEGTFEKALGNAKIGR